MGRKRQGGGQAWRQVTCFVKDELSVHRMLTRGGQHLGPAKQARELVVIVQVGGAVDKEPKRPSSHIVFHPMDMTKTHKHTGGLTTGWWGHVSMKRSRVKSRSEGGSTDRPCESDDRQNGESTWIPSR